MNHLAQLALLASFVLRPAHWDAEAEAWSRLLPHDWPGEHSGELGRRVLSGRCSALELVTAEGRRVGVLVYSVDRSFPTPEFIVSAAFSADGKIDATEMCLPQIEAHAAAMGCGTIRFHTMRRGLIAKTLRAGFRISEVIMRKDIRHV